MKTRAQIVETTIVVTNNCSSQEYFRMWTIVKRSDPTFLLIWKGILKVHGSWDTKNNLRNVSSKQS